MHQSWLKPRINYQLAPMCSTHVMHELRPNRDPSRIKTHVWDTKIPQHLAPRLRVQVSQPHSAFFKGHQRKPFPFRGPSPILNTREKRRPISSKTVYPLRRTHGSSVFEARPPSVGSFGENVQRTGAILGGVPPKQSKRNEPPISLRNLTSIWIRPLEKSTMSR